VFGVVSRYSPASPAIRKDDVLMNHDEAKLRFKNLHPEGQLRVLATFGHELTIVARDAYEFQALGVRESERLRDINEIQHRVFGHICALARADASRYPDEVLLSILFELGDEYLQVQTLRAMGDALQTAAAPER
jgi:hypothetical protein